MRPSLALLVVAFLSSAATRADSAADHVKVDVVADVATAQPGKPFTVGVRFRIDPGWHVYWTNPGDSGLPTTVAYTVPTGVQVGPTRYPTPAVLRFPGDITNYGYEHEVVLLSTVTLPAAYAGKSVELTAQADYLVCQDNCLPGKAAVSLTLPVGTTAAADPAGADVIRTWTARLPRPLEPPVATVTDAAGSTTVRWTASVADGDVQWVPPAGIDDTHAATHNGVTTVQYKWPADQHAPLDGLLLCRQADGSTVGHVLPVRPPDAAHAGRP